MTGTNLKLICERSWIELPITLNPSLPIRPLREQGVVLLSPALMWPRVQMKEEWKRFLSAADGMMSDLPPLAPN